MSFFTQQKSSFFNSNVPPTQNMFPTQDFLNSASDSQLFDSQPPNNSSQQSDDDMESQISAIFEKETNKHQSANFFTQTQNEFDGKDQAELTNAKRDFQLSFHVQENDWFSSPKHKRRAYEETPGSNIPGLANKSVSQVSAPSGGVMSSGSMFGNNYQSPRDQPSTAHSSRHASSTSSNFQTPVGTNNAFLTPAQAPLKKKPDFDDIFNSQHEFFPTQQDAGWNTPLSSQEYSQFVSTQASALLSQPGTSSQCESFGFQSQQSLSQQQLSQASAISEPIDIDAEIDTENTIPKSVRELLEEIKTNYSDAVFTWTIAGHICKDAFPVSAYINLKLCLLFSLVSMSDNSQPLHIAAIGQETSHASIIMRSAGRLAKRFVYSTIPEFEGSCSSRDKEICAGPLLLAKTGILFIGEWLRLPKNCEMKLMRFIETGRVTMEKVQKHAPLECALWAYWSSSNNVKKDASTVNQFISVFGIPTMIDDAANDKEIAEHLLNSGGEETTMYIEDDDLMIYLNYAAKLSVTMEPGAEEMLNNYYLAVRSVRQEALSPKAFATLKQMAESHAKLLLRNQVIEVDVLVAISVCEKYIRTCFVQDAFSSPPEPQFNDLDDIDAYHTKLWEWFQRFTKNMLRR